MNTGSPESAHLTSERELAAFWRSGALAGRDLTAEDGRRLRILHTGLASEAGGPDFRDAAVGWLSGSGCRRAIGDVELHTESRLWRQHGHHRDGAFNQVILHVVIRHREGSTTERADGARVPVLAVGRYFAQGTLPPFPCASCPPAAARAWLERAGDRRFLAKSRHFVEAIGGDGAAQVLYAGLADALGYSANRAPMRQLAAAVKYAELRRCATVQDREDALLAAAGLRPDGPGWPAASMPFAWQFVGVRPGNSPSRRVAALARLTQGQRLHEILDAATAGDADALLSLIRTGAEGYWGTHWYAGREMTAPRALIGKSRAADIAVNVALPFAYALAGLNGRGPSRRRVLSLYRVFPALAANRVNRFVQGRLAISSPAGAREQQGMIYTFRTYCRLGRCSACPLSRSGQAEAGADIQVGSVTDASLVAEEAA